jgi:hypothetical protein
MKTLTGFRETSCPWYFAGLASRQDLAFSVKSARAEAEGVLVAGLQAEAQRVRVSPVSVTVHAIDNLLTHELGVT